MSAADSTGKSGQISITNKKGRLSQAEIERMVQRQRSSVLKADNARLRPRTVSEIIASSCATLRTKSCLKANSKAAKSEAESAARGAAELARKTEELRQVRAAAAEATRKAEAQVLPLKLRRKLERNV